MSSTVTYKGNTLTTVNNQTRVLNTKGTWLEDDITIVDVTSPSISGSAISVVDTTDSKGGTVRTITSVDISDTTAVASDVAQGKYFYTANGTKTAGTATGGSPSVLTTKTITANGTYNASSDNADGYSSVTVNVSGGGGSGTPAHTIYFEYLDGTNTTISVDYSDSIVGTMITSYKPVTHNNKYVGLAQLDGVTWYSPAAIPLNTELIDYSAVSNDTDLQEDGTTEPQQWYGVSDYTMINPTMTFSYKGLYWGGMCFYDETRTFISYLSIYNDGEQIEGENNAGMGILTPAKMPATARYVRISTLNDPDSSILSLIRTA